MPLIGLLSHKLIKFIKLILKIYFKILSKNFIKLNLLPSIPTKQKWQNFNIFHSNLSTFSQLNLNKIHHTKLSLHSLNKSHLNSFQNQIALSHNARNNETQTFQFAPLELENENKENKTFYTPKCKMNDLSWEQSQLSSFFWERKVKKIEKFCFIFLLS